MTQQNQRCLIRAGLLFLAVLAWSMPVHVPGLTHGAWADEKQSPPSGHEEDLLPFEKKVLEEQDRSPIVRIGDKQIPRWMFRNAVRDRLLRHQKQGGREEVDEGKIQKEVLENLIQMELLARQARQAGCGVNRTGGVLRLKIIEKSFPSTEAFHRALEKAGMTRAQYAAIWQQQASVNQWIEETIKPALTVTEQEIEAAVRARAETGTGPDQASPAREDLARELLNRMVHKAVQERTDRLRAEADIQVYPY